MQNKHLGFTIIELLVVIVVIAILAAITIVSYNGITSSAKWTAKQSLIKNIDTAAEVQHISGGSYPSFTGATPITGLEASFNKDYLYSSGTVFDSVTGGYRHCTASDIQQKVCVEPVQISGSSIVGGYGVLAFNDAKKCWVGAGGTTDLAGVRTYLETTYGWMTPTEVDQFVSATPDPSSISSRIAGADCLFGSGPYPVTASAACPDIVPKAENLYGVLPTSC